ncbi:MAG: PAS domain-containing protein [Candidatus Paceibacterota bacterium]|jgi:PAS domain S-box-containing protein
MIFGNFKKSIETIIKKRPSSKIVGAINDNILESERRYRELADSLPQIIFETDPGFNLTFLNNNAISVFGYNSNDYANGMSFDKLFVEENAIKIKDCTIDFIRKKKFHSCEKIAKKKDGGTFPALIHISSILNERKEFDGLRGIIIDISDRKEMEELLKESEEKYRNIIEDSNDPIWVGDLRGNITFFNKEAEKLFGYQLGELENRSYEPLIPREDLPRLKKIIVSAFSGNPEQFEVKIKQKSGQLIDVWIKLNALYKNGKIEGLIAIGRNITEKKKSENLLIESEERYRTMVENSNDMIYILDTQGKITYINPAAEICSGMKKEEIIGQSYTLMLSPADIPRIKDIFTRTLRGEKNNYEAKVNKADGSSLILSVNTAPIYKDEKIIGTVSFAKDITEEKISKNLLLESEERYRTLVENSNDVIWSLDTNGKFVYINKAAESISGYRPEEVVGASFELLLFTEDIDRIRAIFQSVMSGNVNKYEIRVKKKNGDIFILSVNTAPIFKKDQIIGTVSCGRDITEQKAQEKELQKEYSFRKSIEHSLLVGIAIVDLERVMTYVNPAFCTMTGYNEEELLGKKPPFVFWHPDDAQAISEGLKKKVRGEVPMRSFELKFRKKNGETLFVLGLHSPIKNSKGEPTAWMAVFFDITERKEREKELTKMKKAVEYSNEVIFMTDKDGVITFINPEFTKIYGYDKNEIIGKASYKLLRGHEISDKEHEDLKQKIFARQVIKSKILNKTKDGRLIRIEDYTNPIVDDKNNLIGFLAIQHEAEG